MTMQNRIGAFLNLVLVIALLLPATVMAQRNAPAPKLQGYLSNLMANEPTDQVAIIVQKADRSQIAERVVEAGGGRITRPLSLINAFAATVPATVLPQLAASAAVQWVSLDAPMLSQGALTGPHIMDDFTAVSYQGSEGTVAWQGDWAEIGESDGPIDGDVAVTSFWGGALQGLRLRGSDKGILRQADLTAATSAQLHLSFRRKAFQSEQAYVALELSTDGGSSWQEAARWSGPTTNSPMEEQVLDLQAYTAQSLTLRLMTSSAMNAEAQFYLDTIRLDLTLTDMATAPLPNQVYLPTAMQQASNSPIVDKATVVAQPVQASATCTYQCFDLTKLVSTYVKTINAHNIWNTPPSYVRGWGVTVAVVDSGIAPHPDLNDYYGNSRIIGRVNFTPNAVTPDDFYGHGTHIAGTIAGLGGSSTGAYVGVAPEANLVDVKVMDDWGYGDTSDVIAGLQWIYDNRGAYNIRVVNLSLNSRVPESYHESALAAALEVLWFNQIVVVVSAGNGGAQHLYAPANDPFVITVGAMDDKNTPSRADDTMPLFSAYGMTGDGILKPDLVAPGAAIVGPLSSADSNLVEIYPQNQMPTPYTTNYYRMSGTSMAAAVVTGAVALLLEDESTLTPDQVKYRLKSTAQPVAGAASCAAGAGYLDIQAAINGTSTQSANTGVTASQLLWSGASPATWSSVSWNSVSWNSVSWNSVSWNSVSWNSVSWNSVSWNSNDTGAASAGNGSCTSALKRIMLVNADTGQDVQPLYDGAVIDINAIGTRNLTVRADTVGTVESVKFDLNNGSLSRTENVSPYTLTPGNAQGVTPYVFNDGDYQLSVTTYSSDNALGTQGATSTLQFVVAGSNRCELEGSVRSSSLNVPMELNVYNESGTPLEMFWLDYGGQRQSYGMVDVDETWTVLTYIGHPWLIARDSDNQCIHIVPQAGTEANIIITNAEINALNGGSTSQVDSVPLVSDVTGDGKADALVYYSNTGNWDVTASTGTSFGNSARWLAKRGMGTAKQFLADVTGDGKDDAVIYYDATGSWYVAPSSGGTFHSFKRWITDGGIGSTTQLLADVTGDGKADAVAFFTGNGNWYVAPSTGTGFAPFSLWITGYGINITTQLLGDVTGDGKADAVTYLASGGNWYVAASTGANFAAYTRWTTGYGSGSTAQLVGDVTGDGKADAVTFARSTGNWGVAPSSGTAFGAATTWITSHGINSTAQLLKDVTGDRKADAVIFFNDLGRWYVAPSAGASFAAYTLWFTGHGTALKTLGGILSSAPSCIAQTSRTDCFARGTDNALWQQTWNGSTWSSWRRLGQTLTSAPSCTLVGTRFDCFFRGTDNAFKQIYTTDGTTWLGPTTLGGILTSAPSCVAQTGRIDCFGRGTDNALYQQTWNGSAWLGWKRLGQTLTSAPSCTVAGTRYDCFFRGTDNALKQLYTTDGTTWSALVNMGGLLADAPSCVVSSGRYDCFSRRPDNSLWQQSWNGTQWTGWKSFGQTLTVSPSCTVAGTRYDCYFRSSDNAIWQLRVK